MTDFTDMANKGMGATITLPDGRILRLKEEADLDTSVADFPDNYGDVAHTEQDRDTGYRKPRPRYFDGAARIINTYDGTYWWQPPAETLNSPEAMLQTANVLRDILSYGFRVYTLELCDGTDAYGRPIVVEYASASGIEPFASPEDIAWILSDLYAELSVATDDTSEVAS